MVFFKLIYRGEKPSLIVLGVTKKGWVLHNDQGTQEAFDELE